ADADRIVAKIPWARQKKDFSGETYYDPVVHDAQLLYVLARHFPARLNAVPTSVLEDLAAAVSRSSFTSHSAAWILLALDAYAKAAGTSGKFGIAEIGQDGRERALTVTPGVMPKAQISANGAKVQ